MNRLRRRRLRRAGGLALAAVQTFSLLVATSLPQAALAATAGYCATPAKDGSPATITGVVNTYYAGPAGTLGAGSTTVTVGARNAAGSATAFAAGDLMLVMQMQDGSAMSTTNGTSYGTGGTTAGNYEYAAVTSVTGSTVTLKNGLSNSYYESATKGQTYQIVRVPQYGSTALTSGLVPAVWNGASGGILAVDAAATLGLGGATVVAGGLGFRGGGARQYNGGTGANTDYVTSDTDTVNGEKGEGIGGTPAWVYNASAGLVNVTDTLLSANASFGKGAPLNAGGGGTDNNPPGNDENVGGGGGGNGGAGGQGGYNWSPIYPTLYSATTPTGVNETLNADGTTGTGGAGGHVFSAGATSFVMGGGGGAGDRNNSTGSQSSGGPGGGIVLIRAGALSGTGTISANGTTGVTPQNDGGGGGGAGGTVVVLAGSGFGGLTAAANGGVGTDANPGNDGGGGPHGPGGGGGGGVVITSAGAASSVSGGANGNTGTSDNMPYGASAGSNGVALTAALTAPAGALPGEACAYTVVNGPYGAPAATGNYSGGAPDNMHDFTYSGFACSNGATVSNGAFTCGVPAAGVTIPNTLQNTGTATDTFTLSAPSPAGWAVAFYNATCTGGGTTWPSCTRGAALAAAVSVAAGGTLNYLTVFTASAAVAPWVAVGALVTATGTALGESNTTYDAFYPGGPLEVGKGNTASVSNCPAGTTPAGPVNYSTTGICPGGTLTYILSYTNVAPSYFAPGGAALGTEPAFATNALNLANVVITEDGAAACSSGCTAYTNNWAAKSFGLNAVPVDTFYGSKTSYALSNGTQYASGTYPNMTAGYTKFAATLNATGTPATVKPGDTGFITFNVTIR